MNFLTTIATLITIILGVVANDENVRSGKVISLFNVIKFRHLSCQSSSGIATETASATENFREGTCLTNEKCSEQGGTASGNCASGFGVCCVFTTETCGSTISNNCTYLRNTNFPMPFNMANSPSCAFTVNKCQSDVCSVRLDFITFDTLGPATAETPCQDTFTITNVESTNPLPVICGENNGQHIYLELGPDANGMATLTFAFNTAAQDRRFEIKTSQILCSDPNRPPAGCLQYYTGATGQLQSFNFDDDSNLATHLINQNYNICMRKEMGMCCNTYEVCRETAANNGKFFAIETIKNSAAIKTPALTDSSCSTDYIMIEGSAAVCTPQFGVTNKFCGIRLSTAENAAKGENAPVCDCTAPFQVAFVSDGTAENAAAPAGNRGFCLTYRQIPCAGS